MTLYSIYADKENYRTIEFDRDQMFDDFGSLPNHFNVNYAPRAFSSCLKRPLEINFQCENTEFHGELMPDISEHYGRLFLSQKAYQALNGLLENDGEFLPVNYEEGSAYIFNPLSVAESVDGLDEKLSIKDEFGQRQNVAFHEERVKGFMIFKTEFDSFINAYVKDAVRDAIEAANLKGVYFTPDLGDPFSAIYSNKLKND